MLILSLFRQQILVAGNKGQIIASFRIDFHGGSDYLQSNDNTLDMSIVTEARNLAATAEMIKRTVLCRPGQSVSDE